MMQAMRARFSCRTCKKEPLADELRGALQEALAGQVQGPFGTRCRFMLLAATQQDTDALKGLGTYGFVRNPAAFILGAASPGPRALEDFGYLMEGNILQATRLGLGTCWLGGTFTRSSFAARLEAGSDLMPAVVSVGVIPDKRGVLDRIIRWNVAGNTRLPWEKLFSEQTLEQPLTRQAAGPFADALEMVRVAPSASNQQPWRIVHSDGGWDFYLQRTPGYLERNRKLFGVDDLQRVDMGIAMCHFELACRQLGLGGRWHERGEAAATGAAEYLVSFEPTLP